MGPDVEQINFEKPAVAQSRAGEAGANLSVGLGRCDWQKKCLAIGFEYWRAPDSHGVTCTIEQATELLQDLLGVEVEIERPNVI